MAQEISQFLAWRTMAKKSGRQETLSLLGGRISSCLIVLFEPSVKCKLIDI